MRWEHVLQVLIFGVMVIAAGVIAAFLVIYWPRETFAPLYGPGFEEPQKVATPVVKMGTEIIVTGVIKCNRFDEAVDVVSRSWWRRVDNGGHLIIRDPDVSGGKIEPGCYEPRTFHNQLPAKITPGVWVHQGENSVTQGRKEQSIIWRTEPFTVVE